MGASGSEWQYLVEVASMLDEVAIAIAIEKAFEKIAAILGSRGEPVLDRDQALSFAKTRFSFRIRAFSTTSWCSSQKKMIMTRTDGPSDSGRAMDGSTWPKWVGTVGYPV